MILQNFGCSFYKCSGGFIVANIFMTIITLSVGYLTFPFTIKHTTGNLHQGWNHKSMLCVHCFVHKPPSTYPTIEKHIIQIDSNHQAEIETANLLSKSLGRDKHGLIWIDESNGILGVLSTTAQLDLFTLQIVQFYQSDLNEEPSYSSQHTQQRAEHKLYFSEEFMLKPIELMQICQNWPASQEQCTKVARRIYHIASLYGYWDHWRLFQGICEKYQINAQQLLQ